MGKTNSNIFFLFVAAFIMALAGCGSSENAQESTGEKPNVDEAWWKEAVVYQVYPRSFKDSDGDGIGDLQGVISKLDYIKSLGVDVVWLNPIFTSPNYDYGYDVSDYRGIMKEFGTMADFDQLLKEMHARDLKLVLDLVPNHSSSEHPWFKEAAKSRDNPYYNYYHWWEAEKGTPPVRPSFHDASAWSFNKPTNSYYLHYFAHSQPDLNWENPKVRQEMYDILKFWFDKGVDGFRMDVVPLISKDTTFPAIPEGMKFLDFYASGPHLHDYLQEMNREVLSKYNIMTVAEGYGVDSHEVLPFVDPERKELDMLYHFEGMSMDYLPNQLYKTPKPGGFSLVEFKEIYSRWDSVLAEKGWPTIYLGNHDQGRMVTRWGNDSEEFRDVSSKMLSTFLLTMRGTPYYYYGDELGMNNIKFDKVEDYEDTRTRDMYKRLVETGGDTKHYLETQKIAGRDNARTPFQWNDSPHAGFTSATPWLKVNPNYPNVNVADQEKDPNSPLNFFRKLIKFRKDNKTLAYGDYTLLDRNNPKVYSYTRELNGDKLLVLLNFSKDNAQANINLGSDSPDLLLTNYEKAASQASAKDALQLRPYEARVYRLI